MALKRKSSVDESATKRKKVAMKLTQKTQLLDNLQWGMLGSAVACEYGINKSTICYIHKRESENKFCFRVGYNIVTVT
jgi:sugar phosphate permease